MDIDDAVLAEVACVYARAFAAPPYNETAEDAAAFAERVRRYLTVREGGRLVWRAADDGTIAAFALGVIGTPGTWWRDRVAAALGPEAAQNWLGERCFEVVDVGVDPAWQRRGHGRAVLDAVTAGVQASTVLLGCDPNVPSALGLYTKAGFEPIIRDFTTAPGGRPHWVMAKRVP